MRFAGKPIRTVGFVTGSEPEPEPDGSKPEPEPDLFGSVPGASFAGTGTAGSVATPRPVFLSIDVR
ncbi:hypothetical protein JCGZ_04545 [Jatropha curcas]|uniref:Uncharacterized protein n=1 Tax=Jatropha curcas TaxID=180498 RepID=A0A067LDQ0_JATCU|nr:hypothetical protein JCGZ_04545 [Jatropha curcas]